MAKKETYEEESEKVVASIEKHDQEEIDNHILPITQEFGNGDMNTLRDKINEILKAR